MNITQFLVPKRLLIKFLLLPALPAYLIACSTPRTVSPKSEPVKQISEVTEGVKIQPEENPSKRDVEVVEAETYDLIINSLSDAAKRSEHLYWSQKNLSFYKEGVRKVIKGRIGNPKYFLDLLKYRSQLVQMLKQSCISDIYRYNNNQAVIDKFQYYQDRQKYYQNKVGYSIWKVRDGQFLISFICGRGMSLLTNAVFLVTETSGEPDIKPLRLVEVSRDKETGEFRFRPAWDTVVFGSFGPSFDEETGELSIETKGNGSGQLRSSWKYRIENNDFVLVEFRNRDWDYKGSDIPLVYP